MIIDSVLDGSYLSIFDELKQVINIMHTVADNQMLVSDNQSLVDDSISTLIKCQNLVFDVSGEVLDELKKGRVNDDK